MLAGCGILTTVCEDNFVWGVRIEAVDSLTGAPVTETLGGYLLQSSYSEAMQVHGNELVGAGERPGVYSAVITASGYDAWVRTSIEVEEGECHVIPVRLEAELVERDAPE